jgi:hypothetical protein
MLNGAEATTALLPVSRGLERVPAPEFNLRFMHSKLNASRPTAGAANATKNCGRSRL